MRGHGRSPRPGGETPADGKDAVVAPGGPAVSGGRWPLYMGGAVAGLGMFLGALDFSVNVALPEIAADRLRQVVLDRFDMSLGVGLAKLAGGVFRIGHLGDLNDLSLLGALAGVEMGLRLSGIPVAASGVEAAMRHLEACARPD